MIAFDHNKKIDCTLPNLTNKCIRKSTDEQIYPFFERKQDWLENIRGDNVGGTSIVFTRKAVVDKTFFWNSTKICKKISVFDASQLHPHSLCEPNPTGLYAP